MSNQTTCDKMYASTAKRDFGLTDRELKTLQCEYVSNPHYRSGPEARLYRTADVLRLVETDAVQRRLARRKSRQANAQKNRRERKSRILRRHPEWMEKLTVSCEAMFNLNRYAKHAKCSDKHREEIYDLKNKLVKLLYMRGYCVECVVHERSETCHDCGGSGVWKRDWDMDDCTRCDGSGKFMIRDVAFRFQVGEKSFAWHQPERQVDFRFARTGPTESGSPAEVKPVEMSMAKMGEGKVLIRYLLDNPNHVSIVS